MSIQNVITSGCCIIYKTTNILNGMIYPGFHKTSADDGYLGSGIKLVLAVKKYGKANFIRETIEYLYNPTHDEWAEREDFWIGELSACDPNIGYNLAPGGRGGKLYERTIEQRKAASKKSKENGSGGKLYDWTDEQRKRKSESMSGEKNKMFGRHHSDKTRKKISGSERGKMVSRETREKIRKANLGKKASVDSCKKRSESMKNVWILRKKKKGIKNERFN